MGRVLVPQLATQTPASPSRTGRRLELVGGVARPRHVEKEGWEARYLPAAAEFGTSTSRKPIRQTLFMGRQADSHNGMAYIMGLVYRKDGLAI